MRIDLYLFENGYAKSRTEAKKMLCESSVKVNGEIVTKPSFEVDGEPHIELIKAPMEFVSRGGLKLQAALAAFDISPLGRKCLDVGASTGGFTDCLLKNGAESVVAVDSGTMQLAEVLRENKRVKVMENFNARYMTSEDVGNDITLAVMDVSFISSTYIIPNLYDILTQSADFICLIKPQFEVGRAGLSKGGIVKNEKLRNEAVERVCAFAQSVGFSIIGLITSPIKGGDGNTEYLAHFKK